MATRSEQLNWQEIHLSEDEASAQGREERGAHSQDDASSGRSRSPSRKIERPLEREDNSLRYEVQESESKHRRSPSHEVSSSPSLRGQKREREHHARRHYKPKRTPSPSSSPSKGSSLSSSSSSDGYSSKSHHKRRRHDTHRTWKKSRKLQKFKEGGKSIKFQTYDGSYGATDKVLSFVQQFDAAFGGEDFTEFSKLRHAAMHFTKAARQWWASLKTQDTHLRTWKLCRAAIMKQFLTEDAKDEVLTAWRGLKLEKGESIQQYINKFWDLHLKAIVFKKIDFTEQRQQYCVGLTEDIRAYVNDQKPRTIAEVIHRSKVAMKIFPISKGVPKPFEQNEKVHGREQVSKDSKGNGSKGKKDKVPYKGPGKLSPEEMERYKKENRCYKCGKIGHISRACPKQQQRKKTPQATQILYPTKEAKEASQLCFAWGKVRDMNSLILFDPGSTHNFISIELAQKLGIQTEEMGTALEASGAFKGQHVSVTPLIGKLRVHVQGYVDQKEFYISPLSTEDVILGTPWFHRLAAVLEYSTRTISFKFRNRDISIHTKDKEKQKFQSLSKISRFVHPKDVEVPLKAFCMTKEDFHREYGLSLDGKDVRNLTDADVPMSDWLKVFTCLPVKEKKVPIKTARPDHYKALYQLYKQVKSLKDWHQGSAKLMYLLFVIVSNSIVGHIQDADSPKDAWDNLIAFNATNTRAKKIQLKNELNTIKKGDLLVNDYTLKIKALCEFLSSIVVAVDDDDKVDACLCGLGNAYKQFKTTIRTRENIPHFLDLSSLLVVEEKSLIDDGAIQIGRNSSKQALYAIAPNRPFMHIQEEVESVMHKGVVVAIKVKVSSNSKTSKISMVSAKAYTW
ncbi:hypothetical protein L7F22_023003 [Adiantum nelumboides]|nr:hypothetical protein [Adiantum nelumboides]